MGISLLVRRHFDSETIYRPTAWLHRVMTTFTKLITRINTTRTNAISENHGHGPAMKMMGKRCSPLIECRQYAPGNLSTRWGPDCIWQWLWLTSRHFGTCYLKGCGKTENIIQRFAVLVTLWARLTGRYFQIQMHFLWQNLFSFYQNVTRVSFYGSTH